MQAMRIRFQKSGRAKYISHLDLNRCMARALRRAEIPVWYTQGFNPHPYITFALPLSLFYESDCEVMDSRLDGEMPFAEIKERLSAQMPEGITITSVGEPIMKHTEIAFAKYEISLFYEGIAEEPLLEKIMRLRKMDSVLIEKTTKRGSQEVEIKEYLQKAEFGCEKEEIRIRAVLPAGQENLNPSCFDSAFEKYESIKCSFEQIRRTQIYNAQLEPFH